VQIGNVKSVDLDPKNKGVVVHLEILKQFSLAADAKFEIQQVGVLGDQYVIITPGTPEAPSLKEGAEVSGDEPFNLQEVAHSATLLLKRFDQLGATVGDAISRVNNQVLDAQTLSNLSLTIQNFQGVSAHAVSLIDNASGVISNAGPVLTVSLTNLFEFSRKLEKVAMEVDETIVTNRVELNESMKNLRDATASLKQMTADMQAGKGVAGALLGDEQLRAQISLTVSNIAVLSSNLNSRGVWSVLWKPKQSASTSSSPEPRPAYGGKSPFK
jgi:phospholipid/cholesterol/gamma-HCH transport system substrate-binding protein